MNNDDETLILNQGQKPEQLEYEESKDAATGYSDSEALISWIRQLKEAGGENSLQLGEALCRCKQASDKEILHQAIHTTGISYRTATTLMRNHRIFGHDRKTFSVFGQEVLGLFTALTTPEPVRQEFLDHQTIAGDLVIELSYREVKKRIDDLKFPNPKPENKKDEFQLPESANPTWQYLLQMSMEKVLEALSLLKASAEEAPDIVSVAILDNVDEMFAQLMEAYQHVQNFETDVKDNLMEESNYH